VAVAESTLPAARPFAERKRIAQGAGTGRRRGARGLRRRVVQHPARPRRHRGRPRDRPLQPPTDPHQWI